jgi:hypothetical protein
VPNAVGFSLARNRRSPKRPSEPRLSGVHAEEAEWSYRNSTESRLGAVHAFKSFRALQNKRFEGVESERLVYSIVRIEGALRWLK